MKDQNDDYEFEKASLRVRVALFFSFALGVLIAVWATLEYAVPVAMQFFVDVSQG